MRLVIVFAIIAAAAPSAWAQCSNCGKFHGGTPSSSGAQASAQKAEAKADSIMEQYLAQEKASREAYQGGAAKIVEEDRARQAEVLKTRADLVPNAQQQEMLRALNQARISEMLLKRGSESIALTEAAAKEKRPLDPQVKASSAAAISSMMGAEASRLRAVVEQKAKELNPVAAIGKKVDEAKAAVEDAWKKATAPIRQAQNDLKELLGKERDDEE